MHETIFAMFGVAMAVVYIVLGIVIVFTPFGEEYLPKKIKMVFGTAIIVYGGFRLFRSIRQMAA
jgi:hypothetical protein